MARFIRISLGSLREMEYQLLLARDLNYLCETSYANVAGQCDELGRMLTRFLGFISKGRGQSTVLCK